MGERERVTTLLKERNLYAKKSFGQNFLIDDGIIRRIVNGLDVESFDNVIEIGPGLGSLSIPLQKKAKRLVLVDADRDMVSVLIDLFKGKDNVEIVQSDFLRFDIDSYCDEERLIVGNLPYNITSSLLEYMLEKGFKRAGFMVQKEVYDKLVYVKGKKENTPLGAFIACVGNIELVTYVDRSAFYPSPKVDSAFAIINRERKVDFSLYKYFKMMFKDPNKTILNCMKQFSGFEKACSIIRDDSQERGKLRARQMDPADLLELATMIKE